MNVLFIAYCYPPDKVVGIYRTLRFLKYIKGSGVNPFVLTLKPRRPLSRDEENEPFPVYRARELYVRPLWLVPYLLLKVWYKLLKKNKSPEKILKEKLIVDFEFGWILPAYIKARKLIEKHNIELIYISCPPFSSSYIGYLLKKTHNIPLVLDFRDGWYLRDTRQRRLSPRIRKIVQSSNALIVTTNRDKDYYKKLLPEQDVYTIFNGYDFVIDKEAYQETEFTILYLGGWGTAGRKPDVILEALSRVNFSWKFISVGHNSGLVSNASERLGVSHKVELLPHVDKSQISSMIKNSSALFTNQGVHMDASIASKTYDYLASGKPILALLPEGDEKWLIRNYGNNVFISDPDDVDGAHDNIVDLHGLWKTNRLCNEPNPSFLHKFSGPSLSKELVEVFRRITASR